MLLLLCLKEQLHVEVRSQFSPSAAAAAACAAAPAAVSVPAGMLLPLDGQHAEPPGGTKGDRPVEVTTVTSGGMTKIAGQLMTDEAGHPIQVDIFCNFQDATSYTMHQRLVK